MPGGRRNAASRTGTTGKSGSTYASSTNATGRSNSGDRTVGNSTDDKRIDELYNGRSLAPKHVPIPLVPVDGQLTFEIMSLAISIMTTCMQLLNIYKTVWWLPHSYNCYAMNFYLIDPYVLVFIFTIVARRVVYILLNRSIDTLSPVRWLPTIQKITRMSLSITMMSIISWCLYHLAEKHDLLKMFYLCYPSLSIYFSMFGISLTPLINIFISFPYGKEERKTKYLLEKPLHNCSLNASAIRAEVSTLKSDFNQRIKQALFASSSTAFMCGAAPMIFAPSHLYFSRPWVIQQAILFWFGRMIAYFVHICPVRYYDVLHRAALHLGRWVKIPNENRNNHVYIQAWNDAVLWPHGSLVRHNREIYRSEGLCTAAEPGNSDHSRFHIFFYNPTVLLCSVLGAHLLLVGIQLLVLLRTTEWCQLLSIVLLLFMNYYTLFKIARDYLICWKVYRAEQIIQERSQMVVNPVAQ